MHHHKFSPSIMAANIFLFVYWNIPSSTISLYAKCHTCTFSRSMITFMKIEFCYQIKKKNVHRFYALKLSCTTFVICKSDLQIVFNSKLLVSNINQLDKRFPNLKFSFLKFWNNRLNLVFWKMISAKWVSDIKWFEKVKNKKKKTKWYQHIFHIIHRFYLW